MQKIFSLILLTLFSAHVFGQGCTLTASVPTDTIKCGQSVLISAYGNAQGNAFLSENFNNGAFGPGWQSTQQALWTNPCGPGPDGTTHIWMGNSSPVPRILTTTSFNLSSCANAGVTICFDMKFATQGDAAPCEGPDEPQEGVYLQYSTDNGATWTTLHYFDPNGGTDPQFINWRNWCFPVPQAALTAGTKFRWYQDADSGADYDHWGLDNIVIYCNDPTYSIIWPDGYNGGPNGGTNPTPVAPRSTTTYVVTMSNGTNTCADSVKIVVLTPTVFADAGRDTTVCSGQCAVLSGVAKVIERPARAVTFVNREAQTVTSLLGSVTSININVQGLNLTTLPANAIASVCIEGLDFFGVVAAPPFFVDIASLEVALVCPSGARITLVPSGVTSGRAYTNTCFTATGSSIAAASNPYSGSYSPNQPLNNLTGCTANGLWTMEVKMASANGFFGSGNFTGWSITINDPEVVGPAIYSWTPTTNMTNPTTLSPTVCPAPTGAYTLTVSDTAYCVTRSALVNVNSQACCNFSATTTPTQTACGASTGSVDVTPSVIDQYTYAWSDGPSTSPSRTGLAAGTYTVTITNSAACSLTRTIEILSAGAPTLTTASTPAGCSGSTGTATVTVASGTGSLYNWSSGATAATANNLAAGTYTVTVSGGNCSATASVTVSGASAPTINTTATTTSCGGNTGTASVIVTSGTATGYSWSNGANTATASNLTQGTYTVTVTANGAGCTATATATVTGAGAPALSTSVTNSICNGSTGSATVSLAAGTATGYLWSNGATTATAGNLAAGTYTVTVTSTGGCSATATAVVTAPGAATLTTTTTNSGCNSNTGSATVSVTSGIATGYLWSNGATTATASNLPAGLYTVTVTDNSGCSVTASAQVNATGGIAITVSSTPTVCGSNTGTATAAVTSGTATGFAWSGGATTATATNLAAGTYTVTVTGGNCSATASVVVGGSSGANVVATSNKSIMCNGDSAQICATPGFSSYLWNTGETTSCITVGQAGNYYLTVTDQCNFTATSNRVPVNLYPQPPVSVSVDGDTLLAYGSTSYQWYYNGQPVPGGNTGLLIAEDAGSYVVVVTDGNGCTASSQPIEVSFATGVNDLIKERMSVYPNPSHDGNWTLSVSEGWLNGQCEIFDAEGRLVYKTPVAQQKTDIGLNVQSGVYVIRLAKGNMLLSQRLIKL